MRVCLLLLTIFFLSAPHPLVALDWRSEKGHRWAPLNVSVPGKAGFTLLPSQATGFVFTNSIDEWTGAANRVLYNGAGVAAGDFDNDGLPDIFLCNLNGTNALYKNLGNWRFQEVTRQAGLSEPVPETRGAVFADLNGDHHLDLLITVNNRGVICFMNEGHGKFRKVIQPEMTGQLGSTSLALADVDSNGTLDLYIVNYRPDDIRDRGQVSVRMVQGKPVVPGLEPNRFVMVNGRLEECGQPDRLLLNNGAGQFHAVSWTGGAFLDETGRPLSEPPPDWGLTATFRDVNGDGAPDLYVCNDYWTPDRFWINDGLGRFRAIAKLAVRKTSASSMSLDFADVNRDGHPDLFMVDMLSRFPQLRKREGFAQMLRPAPVGLIDDRPQVMRNVLLLNRGDTTFAEMACYADLPASDWSWAPVFLDVDLDGYEDLIIGAGHFRDVQDYDAEAQVRARQHSWEGFKNEAERQRAFTRELMEHLRLYPLLQMPIGAWKNQGDCTFSETTEAWGLNQPGVHQGLALADFDLDGDLDLVVNNLNAPAALYRNDSPAERVAIRLRGRTPNTQGIGARVTLLNGSLPQQSLEIICGGRYQSGSDAVAVFASGRPRGKMEIEVTWRNGPKSRVRDVQSNRLYEISEAEVEPMPLGPPYLPPPHFQDASHFINHRHAENDFNDYQRQPLLPFKLSQMGPGLAWFDLDGDGHDDLVIGAGRGGALSVFRSNGRGQFAHPHPGSSLSVSNDSAGLIGWRGTGKKGPGTVLAGLSAYETPSPQAVLAFPWEGDRLAAGRSILPGTGGSGASTPGRQNLPSPSGGALALGDLQGDGRMALFVAGGVSPGHYPLALPSQLYLWDGRQWKLDAKNSLLFDHLGIVNGAVWSDLDGDGSPELILACEWGPIRVFHRQGTDFFEVTRQWGLEDFIGWWRGVTTGDLNQDGRLDIIASNWGLNSPYRASPEKPLIFVYGQLAQPGVTEIIETEYVGPALAPRRQFMPLVTSMPFLYEHFNSHKAFSEATLEQTLGERMILGRRVAATHLASMAFLNTGRGFKPVTLPREAQFAPAFSVQVADFDGDGHEDVFLSQNFFAVQPETTRIDAGLGLWLRGDGAGALRPVPGAQSGIRIYGEQRGAALCDFDQDGRVDLAVSQNGAATRLYRNARARPGLRVKLKGPPGNPDGINALLRLQFKDRLGPAREIHGGSGYWSQDSYTQIMATPIPPEGIWIRWPGGRVTQTPVPPQAKEITVNTEGQLLR